MRICWRALLATWGVAAMGGRAGLLGAQDICRTPDSTGRGFVREITKYASATSPHNAAVRDSLKLVPTPPGDIHLLQDERVCRRAAAAYRRELTSAAETHTGRVYVLQTRKRYVVLDPDYHLAPTRARYRPWIMVIFDEHWRPLSSF